MMGLNKKESPEQTQYSNSQNLDSRIKLHVKYSTNKYGWTKWVFDQFDFRDNFTILELGCGNGVLWKSNVSRINQKWDLTLSDFFEGMLNTAKDNLSGLDFSFKFEVINAENIPFDDGVFDVVIANHMLYHVPDRQKALAEINRVLKSEGKFYATTVGEVHLQELVGLLKNFDQSINYGTGKITERFNLETGPLQIAALFKNVTVNRYIDSFEVPEAEPLIEYVLSFKGLNNIAEIITGEKVQEFKNYLEAIIQQNGMIKITKDSGIIIANKAE